jgi:hypothetical protein
MAEIIQFSINLNGTTLRSAQHAGIFSLFKTFMERSLLSRTRGPQCFHQPPPSYIEWSPKIIWVLVVVQLILQL